MDLLDPKKQRAHIIRLMIGYVLVGIALILTTIILLYQAYGFGVDRNGKIIQNGLVFVSATPGPASVNISGERYKDDTNTRIVLPAGQYIFELNRSGYRQWKRAITLEGGSVQRFEYPFLFPTKLVTTEAKMYASQPGIVLQSPDRRWLLVQTAEASFDAFDLNNPKKAPMPLVLPADLLAHSDGAQNWELVQWSNDNRHALLKHLYQKAGQAASEYILLDRQSPTDSVNVTRVLGLSPSQVQLRGKVYDQFYLFDALAGTLATATLKKPTPVVVLDHVLAFQSRGDTVLYASDQSSVPGKVNVMLWDGENKYVIRQVAPSTQYLLDLAQYKDTWLIVAGVPAENKVYVYKNPVGTLKAKPNGPLVPAQILKVAGANHISFSTESSRFIMAENAGHFALYDAETGKGYGYELKTPLDTGTPHANWMDGYRLSVVSNGKLVVFDFDSANQQTLVDASPLFLPFFSRDYKFVYTMTSQGALTSTSLRGPQDQ